MLKNKKIISMLLAFGMVASLFGNSFPSFAAETEASETAEASEETTEETAETEESDSEEEAEEETEDTRVIPNGMSIAGIDVSGMTVTEAMDVVNESFSVYDDVKFTLTVNGQTVDATGSDLSICAKNDDVAVKAATYGNYGNFAERYKASADLESGEGKDFSVSIGANISDVIEYLDTVAEETNIEPQNATLTRENGEFQFVEGTSGIVLMVSKSAEEIVDYIENEWNGADASLELPTEVKEPEGSAEELATITDLLGSYSTDYSTSSAARKNNVANGASLVNGTVLYPGEEFSVLEAITPFTAENGYQLAGSYENGTTVETYGGGICQVSTTLYGAVRAAEVEVVTRSCHSMVVNYVLPSQDAAISESGSKDFQIKNNKETPIYIEGYVADNKIYFNIYGKETRDVGHSVSYETEITSVTVQDTTYVADPTLALGVMKTTTSGHTGYTARLWKIITEDGEEVSRDVYNNSRYNPSNRTVAVGIATENGVAADAMNAAIASQNPDTIAAAIATWAPGVVNSVSFTITPQYSVTNPETEETTTDDGITNDATTVDETTGEVTGN